MSGKEQHWPLQLSSNHGASARRLSPAKTWHHRKLTAVFWTVATGLARAMTKQPQALAKASRGIVQLSFEETWWWPPKASMLIFFLMLFFKVKFLVNILHKPLVRFPGKEHLTDLNHTAAFYCAFKCIRVPLASKDMLGLHGDSLSTKMDSSSREPKAGQDTNHSDTIHCIFTFSAAVWSRSMFCVWRLVWF